MLPSTRSWLVTIVALTVGLAAGIISLIFDWPSRYTRSIPPPGSLTSILVFVVCSTVAFVLIVVFTTRWFKHNRSFTPVQTRRIVEISLVAVVIMIIITGVRSILNLYK